MHAHSFIILEEYGWPGVMCLMDTPCVEQCYTIKLATQRKDTQGEMLNCVHEPHIDDEQGFQY